MRYILPKITFIFLLLTPFFASAETFILPCDHLGDNLENCYWYENEDGISYTSYSITRVSDDVVLSSVTGSFYSSNVNWSINLPDEVYWTLSNATDDYIFYTPSTVDTLLYPHVGWYESDTEYLYKIGINDFGYKDIKIIGTPNVIMIVYFNGSSLGGVSMTTGEEWIVQDFIGSSYDIEDGHYCFAFEPDYNIANCEGGEFSIIDGLILSSEQEDDPYVSMYVQNPFGDSTVASTTVDIGIYYNTNREGSIGYSISRYEYTAGTYYHHTSTSTAYYGMNLYTDTYTFSATGTWFITPVFYTADNIVIYGYRSIVNVVSESGLFIDQQYTEYDDIECSLTDPTGCFKKALYWAFVPSVDTMDKFFDIWEAIKNKKPIGYVTAITDQISEIGNGTATSSYTLVIPVGIQENIFDKIRNFVFIPSIGLLFLFFLWHKSDNTQV